jgi:hypothetical protein
MLRDLLNLVIDRKSEGSPRDEEAPHLPRLALQFPANDIRDSFESGHSEVTNRDTV